MLPSRVPERQAHTCTIPWREGFFEDVIRGLGRGLAGSDGGERGIRTLDGVAPKPHFQFAPEEGSEGLLGPTEVRCRCLEES